MKSLNLLKSICALQYGTDAEMAMQAYPAIIRPILSMAVSIVNGSANASLLQSIDVVANAAMQIATGTFKTCFKSSCCYSHRFIIASLQMLTKEPPLNIRRSDMLLRYCYKLWSTTHCKPFSSEI